MQRCQLTFSRLQRLAAGKPSVTDGGLDTDRHPEPKARSEHNPAGKTLVARAQPLQLLTTCLLNLHSLQGSTKS